MEIKYDPAIAANIISVLAMIVAAMSYRLTKKAELSKKKANFPEVTTTVASIPEHPKWLGVSLVIRNHFQTDLYTLQVRLRTPYRAVGLNESQATETKRTGARGLLTHLPAEQAKRSIELDYRIGPHGTKPHHHGLYPGDKAWITFYVLTDHPSMFAANLIFDVEFAVRRTDIRSQDRYVSRQKVKLPPAPD